MSFEPIWLDGDLFLNAVMQVIPDLQLIRRDGLMSALDAPKSSFYYSGEADLYVLAGIYAQRVAKAHAFADCNKRAALIAATTFLEINGAEHGVIAEVAADIMVDLAGGDVEPESFAKVFRR